MMDNRVFNVNGEGEEMLRDTLRLVFQQEGERTTAKAWASRKSHGLILFWWNPDREDAHVFPSPLSADDCVPIIMKWLQSEEAGKVVCEACQP